MPDMFMRRQLRHVMTPDKHLYFPYGRRAFIRSAFRWHAQALMTARLSGPRLPRTTAILLSYARPWNIDPMARMLLRFSCIERVLISNNNPDVDLADFLSVHDERLSLIEQSERRPASMMAMIALREAGEGADYFLSIDDDLFLFPHQIERLLLELGNHPAVPHGLVGQRFNDAADPEMHITGDVEVDVLNRAYAFTATHIHSYGSLLHALGYASDEQKEMLPFGSDIVLSHTGKGRPLIHDVGMLLSCPTAALPGVARFKEPDFETFRTDLLSRIKAISRG